MFTFYVVCKDDKSEDVKNLVNNISDFCENKNQKGIFCFTNDLKIESMTELYSFIDINEYVSVLIPEPHVRMFNFIELHY